MTMTPPSQAEVSSLRGTIERLTVSVNELSTQMLLHNQKQEPLEILVNKHEVQLNGDGSKENIGLVKQVEDHDKILTKFFGNIEKAIWIIVACVLTAVALNAIEIFRAGMK